jgi:SAM-dependent methyltransferase
MTSPSSDPVFFANAEAYQQFMGRYSDRLAPEFAHAARVAAGERVIDVGCGSGALTSVLTEIVGAESVAGVDPSEPFVAEARARVPGADLRVGPAESLPFEEETFDVALSQLVFHFVQDPARAVSEMRRVTRPGGRVTACVWDMTGGMTLIRSYWDAAREAGTTTSDESERFGGHPGQLAKLWRDAGLRGVVDESLTVSADYRDFDELWQSFVGAAGPVGAHAASLDQQAAAAVAEALHRRLGSPDGGFTLTARAWCALGTV